MKTWGVILSVLALLCGCAMGPVSPGVTLVAAINHYQDEIEMYGSRSERWPERQRMADFLKTTFAVTLGRSQEFNRLVDLDLRKREFLIALRDSPPQAARVKEMKSELVKMNEEADALKAAVKRQVAAAPPAQEPKKEIESVATTGLLSIAIDGFSSASNPTGASPQTAKVGPYLVTEVGDGAAVQTPAGQLYRCSTFVVQDEGAGIKCEPVSGK